MTFKDEILHAADGEPIEAIVIGGERSYDNEQRPPDGMANVVLSWDQAAPLLDYEYSSGYGVQDCYSITAWTATKVLFIVEYDGATWVESVPRHPVPHEPKSA